MSRSRREAARILAGGVVGLSTGMLLRHSRSVASTRYPETVELLRQAIDWETRAYRRYLVFNRRASEEGYLGISYLFTALATSELIHAQNYKRVLSTLGFETGPETTPDISVADTKENLITAANAEINSIDNFYPELLKNMEVEGHRDAILNTTYSWESHQQHRDLIQKILKWSPSFFEKVARRIDESTDRYFVCQICGSVDVAIPEGECPICDFSSAFYRQIAPDIFL